MLIREEQPADREQVRKVNEAAFGRPDEADLIDRLRAANDILLSLVAESDSAATDSVVVGHILFSRMTVETAQGSVPAVALAPMAVLPSHQNQKVGSRLVSEGLAQLRVRGERIVIVLGHRHFYPRFGFSSEMARSLASPFPPDAYMALELCDGALAGIRGAVRYSAAFGL
ncbi:MAG TPA: N-acetyltransferase [Bryobacteraceae bacterium]|jgi:putative acetyltransferase